MASGYIGIMEKKMETTVVFRVQGLGFRVRRVKRLG